MALFTLLHQSLSTGQSMPFTMLIFERLAYHEMRFTRAQKASDSLPQEGKEDRPSRLEEEGIEKIEVKEDLAALKALGEPLSWELIHVSTSLQSLE
jgi:hypothetical protein